MPELLSRTRDHVDDLTTPGDQLLTLRTPAAESAELTSFELGQVRYTTPSDQSVASAAEASALAISYVPLHPVIEPSSESWLATDSAAVRGQTGAVRWSASQEVLYGVVAVDHAGHSGDIEVATASAYADILATLDVRGFPHLWRIWNALPAINEDEAGLERYHRFCRARAQAFELAYGDSFCRRLCASTAVGSHAGDGLVVHFLAGRRPGAHRENPRQVSAYRYPPAYGPRSPSFARATVLPAELGGTLFISGTASIVGHESFHRGDLAGQIGETIRNLEVMLEVPDAEDGRPARRFDQLKVYLRHADDGSAVLEALGAAFGTTAGRLDIPTVVLHADICRADLLLEIEAVASPFRRP